MAPLISIIIPLYNKQNSIGKTLESILSQSFNNYEIVVVDDGSTDNSVSVVEDINDDKIHLFQKKNGGPSSARNYGVQKALGEWILFLDADDVLEKDTLLLAVTNIEKHRFADIFTYNLYVEKNKKKRIRNTDHVTGYLLSPFVNWYLDQIYPRTGTMVLKRKIMQEEPFREDLRRHEDTENTFRLMRKYRFYACPQPLFSYNQDTLAASRKREDYHEDFVCVMEPKGKSFFEQMAMFKLYYTETKNMYSNVVEEIYGDTFRKNRYGRGEKYLLLYKKYKGILSSIINRLT
jgi:glycosyltransferase involved in cell wall biosynthesis